MMLHHRHHSHHIILILLMHLLYHVASLLGLVTSLLLLGFQLSIQCINLLKVVHLDEVGV